MDIQGERILLFAPKFFGYETQIKKKLEENGAMVHLYDERNNPTSIEKIMLRKAHFLMDKKVSAFYRDICQKEEAFSPNYILFINPEAINKEALNILRDCFPQTQFILYMWDSCKNKNIKHLFRHFDKKYSFDKEDCQIYGLDFLPLFYGDDFKATGVETSEPFDYAVSFIGTVHSDRAKILFLIKNYCEKRKLPYFMYLYVPGKLMRMLRLALDSTLRKFPPEYIHVVPMPKEQILNVFSRSSYVIDINHPKQSGLTMRTIEMVGLRKKTITTNENIEKYDFYNPINQVVVSRNHVEIPAEGIESQYIDVPQEIYEKYSLQTWVERILS